mmetsp:Transcript_27278/g.52891  ORF Transcript_27278/g.52891 Transcript_27278/m.52891 type:complete len:379 (-) Transcript_27278:175-1311(-)
MVVHHADQHAHHQSIARLRCDLLWVANVEAQLTLEKAFELTAEGGSKLGFGPPRDGVAYPRAGGELKDRGLHALALVRLEVLCDGVWLAHLRANGDEVEEVVCRARVRGALEVLSHSLEVAEGLLTRPVVAATAAREQQEVVEACEHVVTRLMDHRCDRHPVPPRDVADALHHQQRVRGRQTRRRLVREQHPRLGDQRSPYAHPSLLPAADASRLLAADALLCDLGEGEHLEGPVDRLRDQLVVVVLRLEACRKGEALAHRHVLVDEVLLRHVSNNSLEQAINRVSVHSDFSGVGKGLLLRDAVEEGSFATAGRPHDGYHRARNKHARDVVQDRLRYLALGQMIDSLDLARQVAKGYRQLWEHLIVCERLFVLLNAQP